MKKIYLFGLFSLMMLIRASAHSILSFTVTPANPSVLDSIHVIIACEFTSGACDGQGYPGVINGNTINASGFHCVGMLTVICDDYDTVVIPPLAAGSYNFIYTLSVGNGFPCSPGIVPDDIDSVSFTVSSGSGIPNPFVNSPFSIYPNPSNGAFIIKCNLNEQSVLKIYSADAKLVKEYEVMNGETFVNLSLYPGIYTAILENKNSHFITKFAVIK